MTAFWAQLAFTVLVLPLIFWLSGKTSEAQKVPPEKRLALRSYMLTAMVASAAVTVYFLFNALSA